VKRLLILCTLFIAISSLPTSAILDTNQNQLSDLWEKAFNGGNLFPPGFDLQADSDGDGWTNAEEEAAGTDPFDPNSPGGLLRPDITHIPESWADLNGDGIEEHTPEAIIISWPTIAGKQYTLLYSPDLADWLPVPGETLVGSGTVLDYHITLTGDARIFWRVAVTDIDSDGDGLTDAEEFILGTDPHFAQSIAGIPDLWLATHFANILLASGPSAIDPNGDPDGDGLTNAQEAAIGTDPHLADTDGDGAPDGVEFRAHSDPKSPISVPPCDPALVHEIKIVEGNENYIAGKASSSHTYRQFPAYSCTVTYFTEALSLDAMLTGVTGYAYSPFSDASISYPLVYLTGLRQTLWEDGTTHYGQSLDVYAISHDLAYPNGTGSNPSRRSKSMGMKLRLENKWNAPEDTTYRFLKVHIKASMPAPPLGNGETDETFFWNIPAESYTLVQDATEAVEFKIKKGERLSQEIELSPPAIEAGMCHIVSLIAMPVAVDANRDGKITFDEQDTTTAEKPYVFWANDDCDDGHNVDVTSTSSDWEEDDLEPVLGSELPDNDQRNLLDCWTPTISCRRDLEDFSRLWIDFSAISQLLDLSDPHLTLQYRMQRTPAAPGEQPYVTFYQAIETDGGRKYLTDNDTGYNQIQGEYGQWLRGTSGMEIPSRAWRNLPPDGICHLLFECGEVRGPTSIVFSLTRDGSTVLEMPPVYLDIKRITDMYETWTVGDAVQPNVDYNVLPSAVASQTSGLGLPAPSTQEEKDYIMFVHGWNMPPWEKTAFANTMYKRLWHQGYKGRFGAFRWPTFWNFHASFEALFQLSHFDDSEIRAWKSAAQLGSLLGTLAGTYKDSSDRSLVRVYAHSMGNVVASEALRQAGHVANAPVHIYIAAQAALSSHVFDETTTPMDTLDPKKSPDPYGHYWQNGASAWPTQWQYDSLPSYMDTAYMPISTICINHYNAVDWALTDNNWQRNQRLKPDNKYAYRALDMLLDPQSTYRYRRSEDFGLSFATILTMPVDRHEIFSYAARSWGKATGQTGSTGGVFDAGKSLSLNETFGFDGTHKYHSGQFRSSIQKRWEYWSKALNDMKISIVK